MTKKLLGMLIVCLLMACATPQKKSELEMQKVQSRSFDTSYPVVFKSALSVLQDRNFTIKVADMNSGLIHAEILPDINDGFFVSEKTEIIASVVIESFGENKTNLRILYTKGKDVKRFILPNYQEKTDMTDNPKVYEDFFARLEKAIFIRTRLDK